MTAASLLLSLLIARRRSLQTSKTTQVVQFRRDRVYLGSRKLPKSSKLWLPSWRRQVHDQIKLIPDENNLTALRDRAKNLNFQAQSSGDLVAWLGVSQGREFELDFVAEGPHVFVAGPTGSGKSQFFRLTLKSLTSRYRPSELLIYVADFKGSALLQGLDIDAWLGSAIDDLEASEHAGFWHLLDSELERREREVKAQRRTDYDLSRFENRRLLLVIDELAAACRSSSKATEVLSTVAARGRSLGVVLMAASQGMSGVPREMMLNLRLRIALAGTDQVELVQLGGQAAKLIKSSSGWVSARVITQATEDRTFTFPLGVT